MFVLFCQEVAMLSVEVQGGAVCRALSLGCVPLPPQPPLRLSIPHPWLLAVTPCQENCAFCLDPFMAERILRGTGSVC